MLILTSLAKIHNFKGPPALVPDKFARFYSGRSPASKKFLENISIGEGVGAGRPPILTGISRLDLCKIVEIFSGVRVGSITGTIAMLLMLMDGMARHFLDGVFFVCRIFNNSILVDVPPPSHSVFGTLAKPLHVNVQKIVMTT